MTTAATTRAPRAARSVLRIALAVAVLVAGFTIVGPAANPAPVRAGTADYMEDLLLRWINDARAARGVAPLKVGWRLEDFAGDHAAAMAAAGKMWHTSCLSCALKKRSVSFSTCAEIVAWTTAPWGYEAAKRIFQNWRGSSTHWGILMSSRYTRIGLGVAYRSKSGTTYAAGVLVR